MTLIIAEEEAGRIVMGADSAAGSKDEVYSYPELEKIFERGPYTIGSCGNGLIGQVLQVLVEWPEPPKSGEILPFLVREVVPEIRRAVVDAGAAQEGQGILGDTTVLFLGVRGTLFVICADLTVVKSRGWACIGSGRQRAYPTMEALKAAGVEPARERIERTLEVVAEYTPLVRPPWRFLEGAPK